MKDTYILGIAFAAMIMLLYYPPILRGEDGVLLAAVSNAILSIFFGAMYYGQRKELKHAQSPGEQGRDPEQEEP